MRRLSAGDPRRDRAPAGAAPGGPAVPGPAAGGLACALLLLLSGCGAAPDPLRGYLEDRALRREALEGALWFRDNDYARLRLRRFASGDAEDWQRLPQWAPAAAPLRLGAAEAPRPLAVELPAEDAGLEAALLRLGEAAFFDYPAQLVAGFELVERTPALAAGYGLWRGAAPTDGAGAPPRLGGLLRVEVSGGIALALSCAACHAAEAGGRIEPGRPGRLDIGALAQDQAPPGVTLPAAAWGPGRLDVSPDGVDNPSTIPDLRVVALQRHLHHGAALRQEGPLALALRIETLLITSLGQGVRPPPQVALGLALYLRALLPPPSPPSPPLGDPPPRGRALFAARCAGCHAAPDGAGEPVPLAAVGTDGALALSRERGTGAYRTPTLRRVAERGPLLHDGRAADLAALLDGARLRTDYPGGAVPGHAFGLDLPPEERADLAAYASSL